MNTEQSEQPQSQNMRPMPRYKCHKEVWALKIEQTSYDTKDGEESDGSLLLTFENRDYAPIRVDRDYVRKHRPQPGGYYVIYKDGYRSYSPAQAFEEGYTLAQNIGALQAQEGFPIEPMAEAAHHVWMEGKIRDGWTFAATTDKAAKQHSCLIPYQDLSEADKESDRDLVRGIPAILDKAGYQIQKRSTS